jgi:hypothetical protein
MRRTLIAIIIAASFTLAGTAAAAPASERPDSSGFAQATGISALLEGQNQYQALNVYTEPDPSE